MKGMGNDILMEKLLIWDKRDLPVDYCPGQVIIPDVYVGSYTTYRCACYMIGFGYSLVLGSVRSTTACATEILSPSC